MSRPPWLPESVQVGPIIVEPWAFYADLFALVQQATDPIVDYMVSWVQPHLFPQGSSTERDLREMYARNAVTAFFAPSCLRPPRAPPLHSIETIEAGLTVQAWRPCQDARQPPSCVRRSDSQVTLINVEQDDERSPATLCGQLLRLDEPFDPWCGLSFGGEPMEVHPVRDELFVLPWGQVVCSGEELYEAWRKRGLYLNEVVPILVDYRRFYAVGTGLEREINASSDQAMRQWRDIALKEHLDLQEGHEQGIHEKTETWLEHFALYTW